MEVIGKQVHDEKSAVTVEFVGEGGDIVSVHLTKDQNGNLNRLDAEEKAKAIMVQIATFDANDGDGAQEVTPALGNDVSVMDAPPASSTAEAGPSASEDSEASPAVVSLRSARAAQDTGTLEEHLDTGLESSFRQRPGIGDGEYHPERPHGSPGCQDGMNNHVFVAGFS